MNAGCPMRVLILVFAACAALGANAQFGNIDLNKAFSIGKKVVTKGAEAAREFTTEEEIAIGEGATAGFLGASPLHRDQNLQRYVNRVGKWLALHSERPDLPWMFGVIDTETLNAFALPGGSVLVSSGLLKRLSTEAELAGVLAHEIAHVEKRHQISAIKSSATADFWTTLGTEVAGEAISRRGGSALTQQAKSKLTNLGFDLLKDGVFLRPLDRSMEHDADARAIALATRAGYDPYGLAAALSMLAQYKGDADGASLLSTHPPAADRLSELEKVMPSFDRYAGRAQNEQRFRQVVAPLAR